MTPYYDQAGIALYSGDCREVLRSLPERSVQCCVTSPPYWGLRSYEGVEPSVWGGDAGCEHEWGLEGKTTTGRGDDGTDSTTSRLGPCGRGLPNNSGMGQRTASTGALCRLCPAWRGHLGLEPTPELFVEHIVEVFREVWRVLRDDGTLWLNLGDSFAASGKSGLADGLGTGSHWRGKKTIPAGLKPKDLVGIPWRVAFALQADGWYLRSDIVWSKPNPMPESCTDRPTKAHEYVFLLTKKPRYFWDAEAVRLPVSSSNTGTISVAPHGAHVVETGHRHQEVRTYGRICGANLRSVWTIPTQAFKAAHFATYPERLVATCLKAGTSSKGCCPECGTPWVRVVEKERVKTRPGDDTKCVLAGGGVLFKDSDKKGRFDLNADIVGNRDPYRHVTTSRTVGWQPGCGCKNPKALEYTMHSGERGSVALGYNPIPCTVLDPFIGSGTTLVVAKQLGLHGIGIDASAPYLEMARKRIENPRPEPEVPEVVGQMGFFS